MNLIEDGGYIGSEDDRVEENEDTTNHLRDRFRLSTISIAQSEVEHILCLDTTKQNNMEISQSVFACVSDLAFKFSEQLAEDLGMECVASLVINKINVSMVFPELHCMGHLFTPKIASYYEDFYKSNGVNFVKGTVLSSFVFDPEGKVTGVDLNDGSYLPADLVVVGIGIRPNTTLFEGQLTLDKGGIKVNNRLQTSNNSVYAVGMLHHFRLKFLVKFED